MLNKRKQVLTVWGSPGSGKTVTAIKLAKELADQKKNVLIMLCDDICPTIPTILKSNTPIDVSIGEILTAPNITQEVILRNCISFDKNPYICMLGYRVGENPFSYAEYKKDRAVDLLVLLRHIVDYVVIDCSSMLTESIISTVALELADEVLRLGSCDLKSVSYFRSVLPLLCEPKFKADKHIKVLSNVRPLQDGAEYKNVFGGVSYTLPYVQAIEEQNSSLTLFDNIPGKAARVYDPAVKAIAKAVFGD